MTRHHRVLGISMLLLVVLSACGGGAKPTATPTPPCGPARPAGAPTPRPVGPPDATPLANPPAAPAGSGTQVMLCTTLGNLVIEIYDQSAPVASENFVNLADAGFYNGIIFHRVIADFVVQGGDPKGTGGGGPGYTIQDEPVVGEYTRGVVAMARTSAPNSQGSQFFICLDDLRSRLSKSGGYVIFGNVVSGMNIVDGIAAGKTGANDRPDQPVTITGASVTRP